MVRTLTAALALILVCGTLTGAVADGDGTFRLPTLQWPTVGSTQAHTPAEAPVGRAQISWSSLGEFSPVAVTEKTPYGALTLTARYVFVAAAADMPARVEWRLDGSETPVSVADSVITAGAEGLDNSISGGDGVLPAGAYDVTFIINGTLAAAGTTTIQAPPPIGNRQPAEVYAAALQSMVSALDAYSKEDLQQAGQLAAQAAPGIASALQAAPELPDIIAVSEAAHALIALQRTETAIEAGDVPVATEWATRAASHAGIADGVAQDAEFREWTTRLAADTLELLRLLLQAQAQG